MILFAFAVFYVGFAVPPSAGQSNDLPFLWSSLTVKRHLDNGNEPAVIVASNVSATSDNETDSGIPAMDVFRLPTDVSPESYVLEVATDFENMTYSGRVEIVVRATAPTCNLTLNSKDLTITGVRVIDKNTRKPITIVKYYLVENNEQFVIVFNKTVRCLISDRSFVVEIEFEAPLRNDMSGYYKSSYTENDVTK